VEKRSEKREVWGWGCRVYDECRTGSRQLHAVIKGISTRGLGIAYKGEPLEAGAVVKISIDTRAYLVNRDATVVWSKVMESGGSAAGLIFKKEMPLRALKLLRNLIKRGRAYDESCTGAGTTRRGSWR